MRTAELSILLAAGLPLDRCLNILYEISEHRGMKEIIQSLIKSVREGLSFSDTLQRRPNIFPKLYINMVRGERKLNFLRCRHQIIDHIISGKD